MPPEADLEQLAADRDSWRSTCATGLESFAAASEQAASDRRARRHATAQATRVGPACPQCGRVCASDFGLRSHLRVHQRPHWQYHYSTRLRRHRRTTTSKQQASKHKCNLRRVFWSWKSRTVCRWLQRTCHCQCQQCRRFRWMGRKHPTKKTMAGNHNHGNHSDRSTGSDKDLTTNTTTRTVAPVLKNMAVLVLLPSCCEQCPIYMHQWNCSVPSKRMPLFTRCKQTYLYVIYSRAIARHRQWYSSLAYKSQQRMQRVILV